MAVSSYVCKETDLTENKCHVFTVNNRKILLIKTDKGIYATDHKCPHMGLPLTKSKVHEGEMECPFHRARFNIETGNVVQWANFPPVIVNALNRFRKEKPLMVYPVSMDDGRVSVTV